MTVDTSSSSSSSRASNSSKVVSLRLTDGRVCLAFVRRVCQKFFAIHHPRPCQATHQKRHRTHHVISHVPRVFFPSPVGLGHHAYILTLQPANSLWAPSLVHILTCRTAVSRGTAARTNLEGAEEQKDCSPATRFFPSTGYVVTLAFLQSR